jgi:hypothetical protein
MKAKVIDDINVKVLDGEFEGYYFLHPSSVRRDVVMEFTPYVDVRKRKDRPFVGKDMGT